MADSKLRIIIEALFDEAKKDIEKLDKDLEGLGKTAKKSSKGTDEVKKSIGSVGEAFQKVLAAGVIYKAADAIVDFYSSAEKEAKVAAQAQAQLEAVLRSTGYAAGINADEINNMAAEISKTTGVEDDLIVKNEALLLTFTNIGKDVFPSAIQAAVDMSAVLGQDLQSSVVQLGKALNDPIEGVTALKRVGVNFNDTQREMIKNLVESGRTLEAQKFILNELQTEFGGAAQSMYDAGDKAEGLANSVGNLKEAIGKGLIPAYRDFNEQATNTVDEMTKQVTLVTDLRDALASGIITQDEYNSKVQNYYGAIVPASDAQEWLNQKTEEYRTTISRTDQELANHIDVLGDTADQTGSLANEVANLSDLTAKYTDNLVFNKAAANLDAAAALELGLSLGVVDERTISLYNGLDVLNGIYDTNKDGVIDATEATKGYNNAVLALKKSIDGMNDKTVSVTVLTNWITGDTHKPRAAGGPVSSGSTYLVGERGPELFVPNTSGTIVPNDKISGGAGLTIQNVNISAGPGVNGRQVAREFMDEIGSILRSGKAAGVGYIGA